MILITVNWFSFIIGFISCILAAVVIGVVGYFREINGRNKIYKELAKQTMGITDKLKEDK